MHEFSFADAFRPAPVCILGLPLAEYSIGHELLLLRRRNALLTVAKPEFDAMEFWQQVHAIREAIWICSDSFGDRERFERPAWIMWRFRWNEWKRKRWLKRLGNLLPQDYALAAAELRNYLESARPQIPTTGAHAAKVLYGDDARKGHGLGQPLVASLYNFVIELPLGERPKCAWDFPMARAMWLFFSKLETEGDYRIENAEEREEQEALDKWEAEVRGRRAEGAGQPHATETRSSKFQVPRNDGLATEVPEELKEVSKDKGGSTS